MEQNNKRNNWIAPLIIGLCIFASCMAIAFGLAHFRSDGAHTISATGSASVDFESDIFNMGIHFPRRLQKDQKRCCFSERIPDRQRP